MLDGRFTLQNISNSQLIISSQISSQVKRTIAGTIQALKLPKILTVETVAACLTAHPPVVYQAGDYFAAYQNLRSVELARLLPADSCVTVIVDNLYVPSPTIDTEAVTDALRTAVIFGLDLHACPGDLLSLWECLDKDSRRAVSPNFVTKSGLAAALNINRRELSTQRVEVASNYKR